MKLKNEYSNGTEVIEMTEQESEILKALAEGREIKTRDGKEVRIYATDGSGPFGVHGAIKLAAGWDIAVWNLQGRVAWSTLKQPNDLIIAPRTIEVDLWFAVFKDGSIMKATTREPLKHLPEVFALINIKRTVKEGEGL